MGKLADFLPPQEFVELSPGKSLPVRALQLAEIAVLIMNHRADFAALYAESQSKNPSWGRLVATMPDLIAEVVALGFDAPEDKEDVKRLSPGVQLTALEKIWRLTVPDPKALGAALKSLFAELRRAAEAAPEATASMNSKTA